MKKIAILGAAGRDYHDFLTVFKDAEDVYVKAFLQIEGQNIGELEELPERTFPSSLAGERYPDGIPILPETEMESLAEEEGLDEIVLSYSDVSHEEVMHQASRALSNGCGFRLIGPEEMMLESEKPVIAIDAVRTGTGKSQASQKIADILDEEGKDVVVVREPMPYGDLEEQAVQRFVSEEDLEEAEVTLEEREEYERHLERGHVVYAGVDYEEILKQVEEEADVIIWEGGNNELPFFRPDLHFVLTDPHRPGDEVSYHPGETNLRISDYVIVNKENTATDEDVQTIVENVDRVNPDAEIIHADSIVSVENPEELEGKSALVVEDGPTLTHGGTSYGAGYIAAEKYSASKIVDPGKSAVGSLREVLERYDLEDVLPAMGYSEKQLEELEESINRSESEVVIAGTPIDLEKVVDVEKPVIQARYRIEGEPPFSKVLEDHFDLFKR